MIQNPDFAPGTPPDATSKPGYPQTPNSASDAPSEPTSQPSSGVVSEGVGLLLCEIQELAARLRTVRWSSESSDHESIAGKGVLRTLSSLGPRSVPQLALERSTSRQNIQVLANRLVRNGFIEFQTNPRHRRSPLLRVTERGRDLLQELDAIDGEVGRRFLAELDANDVQAALRVVRRFRGVLEEKAAANPHHISLKTAKPNAMRVTAARRTRKRAGGTRRKTAPVQTQFEPDTDTDLPVALL